MMVGAIEVAGNWLMMMLGETTIADGIGIIVFATIRFLLGAGPLALLRLLLRLVLRKPPQLPSQGICVVFEMSEPWKRDVDDEEELDETDNGGGREIMHFTKYLESKIHSEQLGEFDGGEVDGKQVNLHFHGPDAKRIWAMIETDVRVYAPAKPLEVRFELGRKRGGKEVVDIVDDTPRRPQALPDFEMWNPFPEVSRAWTTVFRGGGWLALIGFAGLLLNNLGQKFAGVSGEESMQSGFGAFVIFSLSGMFIVGMILCLICVSHVQRISRRLRPEHIGRGVRGSMLPRWISNRFILAIVGAVITGVLILLIERL